jgi:hypothetical protein
MKKADNFNPGQWLVENKITSQSNLNEDILSQEKQMVFKDITRIINQELTSSESTRDSLVKLKDYIDNLLESDF